MWRFRSNGAVAAGWRGAGIAAQVVGSRGVERNQQDVGVSRRGGARVVLPSPAARREKEKETGSADNQTPHLNPEKQARPSRMQTNQY